jgi:hypothetical protein
MKEGRHGNPSPPLPPGLVVRGKNTGMGGGSPSSVCLELRMFVEEPMALQIWNVIMRMRMMRMI